MDSTVIMSGTVHASVFEILNQNTDEVIMIMNYLLDKGADAQEKRNVEQEKKDDGFWDF